VPADRLHFISNRVRRGQGRAVLHFANPYPSTAGLPDLEWFAETVRIASAGQVLIRFVNNWTSRRDRREERTVAKDVIEGNAELGWVGARVLGIIGARAFDCLQAPMLFRTYRDQLLLWQSEVPNALLQRLESVGLTGLALLPGEMRKPFGFSRPLVEPGDFALRTIRTHESTVGEATLRALGARPIHLSAAELPLARQRCDGMDLHPTAVSGWGYQGYLTMNINLWPRLTTIIANSHTFAALPSQTQQLLCSAARETTARALSNLIGQEQRDQQACGEHVVAVKASADRLAALRQQVEPIYAHLRDDPETGAVLPRLEQLLAC
jgi:TRAP-type C4-dicarboxylate transport system substrate-binding protein